MSAAPAFASSPGASQRVTEVHLRTVLEQLPVALMRMDAAGTLLAVNDAGLGLLGAASLDVVLGTSFLSFLPDEDERPACAAFLQDAAHGLRASRELPLRGVNGEPHVVEVHAVPYPSAIDQAPSVTITLRDVTRTHALTQSLIEATERHAHLEQTHAGDRERWNADQSALADALGRAESLVRERDEAHRVIAEWQTRHDDLERTLQAERAALSQAAEEQSTQHEARVTALESELAAARDDTRRARDAWTGHEAIKRDAERRRQQVEDAVARLAVEIGLIPADPAMPNAAAADDADEARSAW